jgi:hypothetical protein
MRIYHNSEAGPDDVRVSVNPGSTRGPFATIDLGDGVYISLREPQEIDRLIETACEAKRMLGVVRASTPHPFDPGEPSSLVALRSCARCGLLSDDEIHVKPEPECGNDATGPDGQEWYCTRPPAHPGPHGNTLAEWTTGGGVALLPEAGQTCGARPYPAGSEGDDGTVCVLPAGHDGPCEDEPEMCDGTLPLRHGGEITCTLHAGHYGAHSALNGSRRWHGTGADARTEDGSHAVETSAP